MLISVGLSATLLLSAPTQGPPPGCMVEDSHGRCLVIAVDPGRPRQSAPEGAVDERRSGSRAAEGGPAAEGPTGSTAPPRPRLAARPFGDGGWVRADQQDVQGLLDAAAGGQPAAQPATTGVPVEVLAQQAIGELGLAPPMLHMSVSGTGFVGTPMWLWIDGGTAATGPLSTTATAGAAQVTATARLTGVEWSMGPPGEVVRCAGPGTPWTGQNGASPDCSYVYTQRSLPERTGGTGSWTVTATGVWTVTWSGFSDGVPVEGDETLLLSTETLVPIGEVQVLVGGGAR